MTTAEEHQAIRADAERRLRELYDRERRLRPDIDDNGQEHAEWLSVQSQIRSALHVLRESEEAA